MSEAIVTVNGKGLTDAQVGVLRRLLDAVVFTPDETAEARPIDVGEASHLLAMLEPPPADVLLDALQGVAPNARRVEPLQALIGRVLTRQHDRGMVAAAMEMPGGDVYMLVQREGCDPMDDQMLVVDVRIPREVLFLVVCVLGYASTKLGQADAPARR